MSPQSRSRINQNTFLLLWIGVNVAGWMALTIMGGVLYAILNTLVPTPLDTAPYIGFFVIGGGMGVMQWLGLRLRFPITWYEWVIASLIGFGVGLWGSAWATLLDRYIIIGIPTAPLLQWDSLIGGLLLGLAVGCCQGMAWRFSLRYIFAWIIASMLGWGLGSFLADVIAYLLYDLVAGSYWYTNLIIPGGFAGVATGGVLYWLLGRRGEEHGRFSPKRIS